MEPAARDEPEILNRAYRAVLIRYFLRRTTNMPGPRMMNAELLIWIIEKLSERAGTAPITPSL